MTDNQFKGEKIDNYIHNYIMNIFKYKKKNPENYWRI